jgi:Virulence factor BrkB
MTILKSAARRNGENCSCQAEERTHRQSEEENTHWIQFHRFTQDKRHQYIGFYLLNKEHGRQCESAYGAAGSLITMLIWIYYAAQIVLFGAEFTRVYAQERGRGIRPAKHAVRVDRKEIELPPGRQVSLTSIELQPMNLLRKTLRAGSQ